MTAELIVAAITAAWLGGFAVADTVKATRRRRIARQAPAQTPGPLVYVPAPNRNSAA